LKKEKRKKEKGSTLKGIYSVPMAH